MVCRVHLLSNEQLAAMFERLLEARSSTASELMLDVAPELSAPPRSLPASPSTVCIANDTVRHDADVLALRRKQRPPPLHQLAPLLPTQPSHNLPYGLTPRLAPSAGNLCCQR